MTRAWPALLIRAASLSDPPEADEILSALLDDYSPLAIEDLAVRPLPPGGLWDPTFPPIPEPPPSPLNWRVFFSDVTARDAAMHAIHEALPRLEVSAEDVPDEDWAARSQASLTAVHAGAFVVAPPWNIPAAVAEGVTLIVIEPSMGFGTGHHQTTRLCLRVLSDVDVAGQAVLDLGTGSGVLAMAAAMRGARAVEGVDLDADAIASAETSARLNPLPPTLRFRVADFRTDTMASADVVLANLTGGMLTTAALAIAAFVRPGGTLILSGFDNAEVDAVARGFSGFVEVARISEDTWVALHLRKP